MNGKGKDSLFKGDRGRCTHMQRVGMEWEEVRMRNEGGGVPDRDDGQGCGKEGRDGFRRIPTRRSFNVVSEEWRESILVKPEGFTASILRKVKDIVYEICHFILMKLKTCLRLWTRLFGALNNRKWREVCKLENKGIVHNVYQNMLLWSSVCMALKPVKVSF